MRPAVPHWVRVAYAVFYAEFDSSFVEHPKWIANEVPDGLNHIYEIQRSNTTNQWDFWRDWVYQGTSQYQPSSIAYEHQVGLEISRAQGGTVGSWAHADTFDNNYLQVLSPNVYQWVYWWYHNQWIDQPCGQGWSVPNCLNGVAYAQNEWSDNKP